MYLANSLIENPLPSHALSPSEGQQTAINVALYLLEERVHFVRNHVKEIFWMKLRDDSEDECITSASFPEFPGRIFISDKALVHIPPFCIFSQPNLHALAENIYHEAIHQHVNGQVLSGKIMANSFDSAVSPKIEIAWRKENGLRNQFWELDRAYHAACVYSGLLTIRRKFARLGVDGFEQATADGQMALDYLLNHLESYLEYFKPDALMNLRRMRTEPYV